MTDVEVISHFASLFTGNTRFIGLEEGGCVELGYPFSDCIAEHLRGIGDPIGVYPIYTDGESCRWGCIDFDEGEEESWVHAQNVRQVLAEFDIQGNIERSRSKGYHVWVFCHRTTKAALMRRALLTACQLVDAPTREINPKQERLNEGQVGSYVRLPYPAGMNYAVHKDQRRVMLHNKGAELHLKVWLETVDECAETALQELAKFYKEPARPRFHVAGPSNYDGEAVERLSGLAKHIWEYGPLEESDRSSALWKLAMEIVEAGNHDKHEVLELVRDADERWGKFAPRADVEIRLEELVDRAWNKSSLRF